MLFQDLVTANPEQITISAGVYAVSQPIPKYYRLLQEELDQMEAFPSPDLHEFLDRDDIKEAFGKDWIDTVRDEGLSPEEYQEFLKWDTVTSLEILTDFYIKRDEYRRNTIAIVLKNRVEGLEGTIQEVAEAISEQKEDMVNAFWTFVLSESQGIAYTNPDTVLSES